MAVEPTAITREILNYINDTYIKEDRFFTNLQKEATQLGIPEIRISADQAKFLQLLIKILNAKFILEIGSLAGYSAIKMALALPAEGKLIALEIEKEYAVFFQKKAEEAGLEKIIDVKNVDAIDFLDNYIPVNLFDLVFIDANKTDYTYYLEKVTPMLKKGGVIAFDNALAFGELFNDEPSEQRVEVEGVKALNEALSTDNRYFSTLITIGDGIAIGVKL